jgi:hypothetical protein
MNSTNYHALPFTPRNTGATSRFAVCSSAVFKMSGLIEEIQRDAGRPQALNPYRGGWIPIILGNNELDEMLASCDVRESVASLESLVERSETGFVQFPIPPGLITEINNLTEVSFGTMSVHLSITQVHGLLDCVRNMVLDWALKLERVGIKGEGMTFNREEKQLANAPSNTFNIGNIGSMVGNLGSQNSSGDITGSAISVDQVKSLADELQPHLSALKAAGADGRLLDTSLANIHKQGTSRNPDQSALRGALTDLRNALSGAAGNLIASGAIAMISKMIGG